jgi:2-oxoglutarate ferredoxin oxidoreductase subunit alpha
MRLNILIGGKAGQGINKVSEIISKVLNKYGYFTFNYRDYQSLIRGGHNFNILSVSDKWIASHESEIDFLVALDKETINLHKKELRKSGILISYEKFSDTNERNLNIILAGALTKLLGIPKQILIEEVKNQFPHAIEAAEQGYSSEKEKLSLKKLNNKIKILSGSNASAIGAINSKIDLFIAYPMTPATGLINALAEKQIENNYVVFQPESEVAAVNQALGASFSGANVMTATSGGGFDLMTEGLSMAGQAELPVVFYLASRPGPSTGIPTYTSQDDLDLALRAGHGEFPRIVTAPGDPLECIEKTNELFYLSNKFNCPSILLTDKHLAESEYSINKKENPVIPVKQNRKVPGKAVVKYSSYEHDKDGNTAESAEVAELNAKNRLKKYSEIKKEIEKLEPIKIFGKQSSKNLIIGWGSTKGAILDAIKDLDCKFLQVLYMKPLSDKIKSEMQKAKNIILIENNLTGQLGRILREKTGISIPEKNRILKYNGRPFTSDELNKEIKKRLR